MSKHEQQTESTKAEYGRKLYELRVQLVKLQNHVIRQGQRVAIVLEGRDAAGKDGAIKRMVKNLSPRETRVVALAKPSNRDETSWYFQRYVRFLPAGGEIVIFNRSWYNRAGVESVMGFCTPDEHASFLEDAPRFEELLVRSGTVLRKFYLDIAKSEQKRRLADRARNPLEQWKVSPIDDVALEHWRKYSEARNEMLARTHTAFAPWTVVQTNDKRIARVSLIQALLASVEYRGKEPGLLLADPEVVFAFGAEHVKGRKLVVMGFDRLPEPFRGVVGSHVRFPTNTEQAMDIEVTFPGGKRVDAQVGAFNIQTDQPSAGGGNDSAPAPFDLFLASIATCAGIYVLGFCQARGLPTDGVRLRQSMTVDEGTHLPTHVAMEINLPAGFPEKYRPAIVRAAEGCKVKKAIAAQPTFTVSAHIASDAA